MEQSGSLRIVHCFRSPVGGIFRHVRDLAAQQSAAGHKVGLLCDSSTGAAYEDGLFKAMEPHLALGLIRIPMRRAITPGDIFSAFKAFRIIRNLHPDVLHSHGAKGGAYARIVGSILRVSGHRVARLYCPHGGSVHYDPASLKGKLFFALERVLERMSDRLIFVSRYEADGYRNKIGEPACPWSLVYNGLSPQEFEPVREAPDAADFLYIGMMRDLKGPDVFLSALALLHKGGRQVSAHFIGEGPDKSAYLQRIAKLGLENAVRVHEAMPARRAFAMAKVVVVPSRAESMPYIVLETIAAAKPIIATNVGGIPEIFTDDPGRLIEPGNVAALAAAMLMMLDNKNRNAQAKAQSARLQQRFSVEAMAMSMEQAYRSCV